MTEDTFQMLGTFKLKDFDIRLPKLGLMRFSIMAADEGAVYIMYFKKTLTEGANFNPEEPDPTSSPYCYTKVKLGELEKTLHAKMQNKVLKKINKLKEWLIQQDVLLSQIQSTCREVKL